MIPSWRLYGLLLVGLPLGWLIALSTDPSTGVWGSLVWDLGVLAVAAWDHRRSRSLRAQIRRQPLGRLSIGRENPVQLQIQLPGSRDLKTPWQVQIRDQFPLAFQATPITLRATLEPQQTEDLIYHVIPPERGEFHWGPIHLQQLSRWGLVWDSWQVDQSQSVPVYPDLIGLKALSIRLTLQSSGSLRQARRLGMGTEFAELREYSEGDDMRSISWKATARRLHPIVQVLEPEHEQTLIILLDRGRLMTAQVQQLKRFDWGLNAALALSLAGLERGDKVGVGVFDRSIHTWIPAQRGRTHLTQLIERLTPIQPDFVEPDYMNAATVFAQRQHRRALVVILTDIVDATASSELLAALMRLSPRYLPFCVALRDPQVDHQAHTPTQTLDGAYARAVALDLLAQRQVAMSQLKHKGVMVLDAPVNQISDQLVDRYLQLKLRNRL